jgi:transcriptional regulator with XRE-family HTH domain
MNHAQSLDSRLNVEEQMVAVMENATPAVVPVHVERALPLHRLGEARRQEQLTRHTVARCLDITVEEVRRQECETTDLPLSVLHKWAEVLHVPVAELVQEPGDSLSMPLFNRAHMVLVMKTAAAILERAGDLRTKRLAQSMVDQLIEIMPELRGVSAWPTVGKSRRRLDELGSAAERSLPDEVFGRGGLRGTP